MKKILSLALILATVLAFAGIASAEETLKLAVVVSGSTGDNGFYDSAVSGLNNLVANGYVTGNTIECKNDASMFTTNIISAAEDYDIVVAVGWEFWDVLCEVVPEFTDTKFIFIDNGLDGIGDNLMSITYAQNEGSFLVGYIAGKLSETGKIGAIGGEDSETINDFIVGYEAGAKLANPEIEVQVKYSNTYDDPAIGKEIALALYDNGCDIIFQVADKCGIGAFEAAAERNLFAIGVDTDQKYMDPDHIICSMKKEVGLSIEHAVNQLLDGEWLGGQIWVADLASAMVDVGYGDETMPQQVSDELKAEVEAVREQILAGEVEVPTAF